MNIYAVEILDISNEKLNKLCSSIDSDKRCRIEKFINKKDKIRTLIGDILIRTKVIEELGIENKYIEFDKNQYGKPFLKNAPEFYFNISHSGNFVLGAVDSIPLGIDVEEVKCIEYEDLAKSFFTKSEFDYIFKVNPEHRLNRFYKIWNLKESYIKCCGKGLTIPLKSFSFDIDNNKKIKVITENIPNNCVFKTFDLGLNYKAAICSLSNEVPDSITIMEQNSLIEKYLNLAI